MIYYKISFLIVLMMSVVCFSADSAKSTGNERRYAIPDERSVYLNLECKTNVQQIFYDCEDCPLYIDNRIPYNNYTKPVFAFKFAMFSLSEKFIESMTSTKSLGLHFKNQYVKLRDNNDFKSTHKDIHDYFKFYGFRAIFQNKTLSESEKYDITGYFTFLVKNFHTISEFIQKSAKSPKDFCEVEFSQYKSDCRMVLSVMLDKKVAEIEEMEADKAFNHCYLNCTHHDFTYDKLFSPSGSSGAYVSPEEELFRQLVLNVMNTYFRHLMDIAHWISLEFMDSKLFPTIEEYCEGRNSN